MNMPKCKSIFGNCCCLQHHHLLATHTWLASFKFQNYEYDIWLLKLSWLFLMSIWNQWEGLSVIFSLVVDLFELCRRHGLVPCALWDIITKSLPQLCYLHKPCKMSNCTKLSPVVSLSLTMTDGEQREQFHSAKKKIMFAHILPMIRTTCNWSCCSKKWCQTKGLHSHECQHCHWQQRHIFEFW